MICTGFLPTSVELLLQWPDESIEKWIEPGIDSNDYENISFSLSNVDLND